MAKSSVTTKTTTKFTGSGERMPFPDEALSLCEVT